MAEWTEGWLRRGLADWLGPSWRSTMLGCVIILMGILLVLVGALAGVSELKVLGLGMLPTGILAFLTRDQKAHDEHTERPPQAAKEDI
jgi:uncharacterized membrane protein HdeD (DUF308 family)